MPKGPQGQKRPADVIGNAVRVMRIATGAAAGGYNVILLAAITAEQLWNVAFRQSADQLSKFASKALSEHQNGKTRALDPETL